MNLFGEKKGIFLKIANIILLIWFVGALVATYATAVDLLLPQSIQSYDEYKYYSCRIYDKEEENRYYEDCEDLYNAYKASMESNKLNNKKPLIY